MLQRCPSEELGYPPLWEDTPVTLQVALVGTDGIVLASDRKTVLRGNGLVDRSFLTSKILIDSAQGLTIAHSGHQFSEEFAELIQADDSPVEARLSRQKLDTFASEVWKRGASQSLDRQGELIIVWKDDLSRVLHVDLSPLIIGPTIAGARAKPRWITDKVCAGHASNPAIFFSQHYYEKKPIADLVFLAAHIVLSGRPHNPLIDGLEVVKCTQEGFERLPDSSISEIVKRSDELDERIGREIFTPFSG
jgi:hypothetical protein